MADESDLADNAESVPTSASSGQPQQPTKKQKPSSATPGKTHSRFQDVWFDQFDWLEYDNQSKRMFCKVCRAAKSKNIFSKAQLPFDPSMKKKKKKKKTGFDPDALDGGDVGNDTTAKVDEPAADTSENTEQTQEKSIDEDFSLDFGGLKKKKKKKKTTFEMDEMKEALPAEPQEKEAVPKEEEEGPAEVTVEDDFSSFGKKKKKKKPVIDIDEIKQDEVDATTDDFDAVDTTKKPHKGKAWLGSDRDYSYDELLTRVFDIMRVKNPEMVAGEKKKIVMRPPQVLRAGARRTSFANFSEISRMLHRQSKHLLAFIFAELGTSGSVDGNNQLIIRGRFNQKQIENVLRRYIKEYVTCHTCKSPDTLLQKEERLFFLQCETCGSRCSVASIKSGFQAVTGRRAAMRANAQ